MGYYFEDHHSMLAQAGMDVRRTLDAVVRRYIGLNPPHPLTFRAFNRLGLLRGRDYRYHADFNRLFPDAEPGQYVHVWAKYWCDNAAEILFDLNCHCPTMIHVNRTCVFASNIFQERYPDERHRLTIALTAGWNHFVIRFRKTSAGFGGVFGTWLGKLPYYFLLPDPERDGQEGWLYSEPMTDELREIPAAGTAASGAGITWLPRRGWDKGQRAAGQLKRMYGMHRGAYAVGWTRGRFLHAGIGKYALRGRSHGPLTIFVGDKEVFSAPRSGPIATTVKVPFGLHDVMVRSECRNGDWGFDLQFHDGAEEVAFDNPANLTGSSERWIYAGPVGSAQKFEPAAWRDLHRLVPGLHGETYWRLDAPDEWVRPYNENALYGKWNYPLGVTLYGVFHAAGATNSAEARQYVVDHIQRCCDTYHYAMWDREQYGGATNVHHLLTSLDSLDDCGSFGSAMLEIAQHAEVREFRPIADLVADYIANRQIRLPDGTFFRKNLMHEFHEDTMWADDLYMSVPFLCRYYRLSGDARYIDDAARQFLGFKKRLFLPRLNVMSHVFDFTRDMATGIPWGRGNGWVIFSLSELLEVLPAEHALRPQLLAFFRQLSDGFLALQGASGMWHQVLDEHDSYPETSCTSMFAYAFARGVRFGWYENPERFVRATLRAWEAINRTGIDRWGNVHGVCRGSEFSFQSDYYKKDLLWNLNDTHGIGIVLLAGVEVQKLFENLQTSSAETKAPAPVLKSRARRSR